MMMIMIIIMMMMIITIIVIVIVIVIIIIIISISISISIISKMIFWFCKKQGTFPVIPIGMREMDDSLSKVGVAHCQTKPNGWGLGRPTWPRCNVGTKLQSSNGKGHKQMAKCPRT
jgi:hypothetical protein